MTGEMIQLAIILSLATLNALGVWYLNRLWNKENSQKKDNAFLGRSR